MLLHRNKGWRLESIYSSGVYMLASMYQVLGPVLKDTQNRPLVLNM